MHIRRLYLLITLPFALFTSCDKDEPDTTFAGTWLFQASEKRDCTDSDNNSDKDSLFIFNTPCNSEPRAFCSYEQYIFSETTYSISSSSTLITIPISISGEGTYTISDSTLTVCENRGSNEQNCKVFEYSINGKTMSLAVKNAETGCLEINYYLKQ